MPRTSGGGGRSGRSGRSLNGTTPAGQAVDVQSLQRLVAGADQRRRISPEDPVLTSAEDLELLQRVHALGPLGPFATLRNRGRLNRLTREGLLTLDGALDTAGEQFMETVSSAEDVLAVRGSCGRHHTLLQGWLSADEVSVVTGPPGPDLVASVEGLERSRYTALTVDRGSLASQVCAWAGVRTFPAALGTELLLPEETFSRRVADACAPVPDAGELFGAGGAGGAAAGGRAADDPEGWPTLAVDPDSVAAWWAEPWFVWEVTSVRLGVNLGLINAQGAGNYVFGGDRAATERAGRPMVRVAPVTAQTVWETLWLLAHGGGVDRAAGAPVLGSTPRRGRLGEVPVLPREPG